MKHLVSDLISVGEPWKNLRSKLQPDILSPQVAASYLPSLNKVSRQASEVFPLSSDQPHEFTSRVAFDMFTAAILGKSRGILFPETALKVDHEFIENSTVCMRTAGLLAYSPIETMLQKYITTPQYKIFKDATDKVYERSAELVNEALDDDEKKSADSSTNTGNESYLRRLIRSGSLTSERAGLEVTSLLLAAVDTTSNYMNWLLLNLARNPEKQRILAEELRNVLKGDDFNKDVELPYLQACYRECHRLTPVQTGIYRILQEDIVINEFMIPKGTKLTFNLIGVQYDPTYVESPEMFLPERWLSEAVEKRKGTVAELLDHKLLSTPFSFGSRMCLGGRLAEMEIKSLIARIVQDYEFVLTEDSPKTEAHEFLFLTPSPAPKYSIKKRRDE